VRDPNAQVPVTDVNGNTVLVGGQAAGFAGDLSFAFSSVVTRADPQMNVQPSFYPPLVPDVQPGDPFTPLMRAYEGDSVQIRLLVGANEETHTVSVNGLKWLHEPSDPNSGWRNAQLMGISEHFEFVAKRLDSVGTIPFTDHLWKTGSAVDDLWNGTWGFLRLYDKHSPVNSNLGLQELPNNRKGSTPGSKLDLVCPVTAPVRHYDVTAVTAQALPGGTLVYNSRGGLNDPTAILFVRSGDLNAAGLLKAGVPIEPLVLRAAAGDCITVTLTNALPATLPDLAGFNTMPGIVDLFNANQVLPSSYVGLHPQLVDYFMAAGGDGMNIGFNPLGTAPPGGSMSYRWYAGDVAEAPGGFKYTPIEFGAINLSSSDPIKHSNKGAIGALIVEPLGSSWTEDLTSRASATVTKADHSQFREFVLLFQDDINFRYADGRPVPLTAKEEDPEDSGQKALNYRTEPNWLRLRYEPDSPLNGGHGGGGCLGFGSCPATNMLDYTFALSNTTVGGDPETPVFTAKAGTPVRFRILEPGGHPRGHVFNLHGHVWQEEPYINGSTQIGDNPLSEWKGSQNGHGPSNHFDIVPMNGAGGAFKVPGDYLYRDQQSFMFDGGLWGIFRVTP
jgi:manganese oxidase